MNDQKIHDGSYAAAEYFHTHPLVAIVLIILLLCLARWLWTCGGSE